MDLLLRSSIHASPLSQAHRSVALEETVEKVREDVDELQNQIRENQRARLTQLGGNIPNDLLKIIIESEQDVRQLL